MFFFSSFSFLSPLQVLFFFHFALLLQVFFSFFFLCLFFFFPFFACFKFFFSSLLWGKPRAVQEKVQTIGTHPHAVLPSVPLALLVTA